MDPNADTQPSMHLPEPLPAGAGQAMPQGGAPEGQFQTTPSIAASTQATTTASPLTNLQARDEDMIEREWVIKAKQIITSTSVDPYEQTRQLAALKADYLQKRYNKVVKLSE